MKLTQDKIKVIVPARCKNLALEFTVKYILKTRLGLENIEIEARKEIDAFSIEIDNEPIFRFPCSDLFSELDEYKSGRLVPNSNGFAQNWEPFTMATSGVFDVNFDLFASIFYLVARIDEFLPSSNFDDHGRFLVTSSLQFKYKAHQFPVVDIWIKKLRDAFANKGITTKKEEFRWWNTVDVDQVFASQGKPLIKRVGRQVKKVTELKLGEAQKLAATFVGKPDPFDVLPLMHSTKSRDIAFYLVSGNTAFDHPETRNDTLVSNSINQNKLRFEIGLHPSYATFNDLGLIESEKNIIENVMQKDVVFSRQHYLHYKWPNTPALLNSAGITHDFTMGFADEIGFRAGTSRPFPFFNLLDNEEKDLTLVPFSIMDVTLKHYLELDVKQAKQLIFELIENVKACDGLFISLWHNESLSEIDGWKGWKSVYMEMKDELTK
ncbi:MAG: polysaccharide deacetylase family protein [Bacteroidia bacterium]